MNHIETQGSNAEQFISEIKDSFERWNRGEDDACIILIANRATESIHTTIAGKPDVLAMVLKAAMNRIVPAPQPVKIGKKPKRR